MIKPAASSDLILDAITTAIVKAFRPRRIVLFGSRARGDVHEDSDYDLMVELSHVDSEWDTAWKIKQLLPDGPHVDITVRTPARFEERRDDPGTLDWDISREGIVVYPPGADSSSLRPATRVRERAGPPESVGEWLSNATDDVVIVEQLLTHSDVVWSGVCFHAQQAGEKYLKALLVHHRIRPARTHDLSALLAALRVAGVALADLDADCKLLSQFSVDARYPSKVRADATSGPAAAAAMRRVVAAARSLMNLR